MKRELIDVLKLQQKLYGSIDDLLLKALGRMAQDLDNKMLMNPDSNYDDEYERLLSFMLDVLDNARDIQHKVPTPVIWKMEQV